MAERKPPWIEATEAVELLGVNRATLYAYVSRGLLRSEPMAGGTRRRRYSRDDIERLVSRNRERRNPEKAAEQALHLGMPVLESGITLIANERVYYRGRDVSELARTRSVADVAALLWTGNDANDLLAGSPHSSKAVPHSKAAEPHGKGARPGGKVAESHGKMTERSRKQVVPFMAAAQSALALAGAHDPLAYDLRPHAVAQTGWRIAWQLADVAARTGKRHETIDATLAHGWGVARGVNLIRAALILCADHELNVSAFTVRCVASAGASPYNVVIAGLAALEGTKHGGTTARIEAAWDLLRGSRNLTDALAERLRRDEPIDGFGHPLYPHGDPRATLLLDLLPKGSTATFARELASAAKNVLGDAPTVDFALVAVARALGLPPGAPLTLFAIGRTLGWIAHAIEQYEKNVIIRPRARYVGEQPHHHTPANSPRGTG